VRKRRTTSTGLIDPIAFAVSVWDGFHPTLVQWFCRYIQIYLWLPVSDMFSTILARMQKQCRPRFAIFSGTRAAEGNVIHITSQDTCTIRHYRKMFRCLMLNFLLFQ